MAHRLSLPKIAFAIVGSAEHPWRAGLFLSTRLKRGAPWPTAAGRYASLQLMLMPVQIATRAICSSRGPSHLSIAQWGEPPPYPTVVDCNVLALDIAGLLQTLTK